MFIEDIIAVGAMPGMQNALFTIWFFKYVDHSYMFVEPFCIYLMVMKK